MRQIFNVIKKFNILLPKKQHKNIIFLTIMMIIGGLLEMLSVSLVLPFVEAIMSPTRIMDNNFIQFICQVFNLNSNNAVLILIVFSLAGIYILKNIYLILEYNLQFKFVYNSMHETQCKLLHQFLHRNYEFYLTVDTGEVIRLINSDTQQTFRLLSNLLNLLTEIVVTGALICAIFIINPAATICIAVLLFLLILIINNFLKPILRKAAVNNQYALSKMNKWLIQSIQGIKELIVMHKEDYFENNFKKDAWIYSNMTRKNDVFSMLPRFLIEATCMSSMFIIIGIMILVGQDLENMIPLISVIAMAALRLLPSTYRMSSGLASISFNEPMLDKLIENTQEVRFNEEDEGNKSSKKNSNKRIYKLDDKIELNNISYKYPNNEEEVFKEISIKINKGDLIGLIGASGAGKTTIVDVILGLLQPQTGDVFIDDINLKEDISGWLSQVGYIPQMIFMLDDSIRANVAFGIDFNEINDDKVWNALKEASLYEFVKSLPMGLDTQIGERGVRLSGGQRQRIGIARVLYTEPSVLIFDEATSALDNETEKEIMKAIYELKGKTTMIIIAHRLTTLEHCNHIFKVEKQEISIVK